MCAKTNAQSTFPQLVAGNVESARNAFLMESKIPGRYIIIPILYIAIIAGLIYAQFGRSSKIDLTIGNIELSATFAAGSGNGASTPTNVSLNFGSMEFLSDSGRLIIEDATGNQRPIKLLDYLSDTRRVAIDYENQVHLAIINTSPNRGALEIRAIDSNVVAVGFQVSDSVLQPDDRVPVFLEDGTTAIFPVGTFLDPGNRVLWVPMMSPAQSAVLYRVNPELVEEPFLFWLGESYTFAAQEEIDSLRSSFVDAVYNGWTGSRYTESSRSWKLADGTVGFDETVFALMIAESLTRGSFRELYARILSISGAYFDSLSYRTAPLLGNVVRTGEKITDDNAARIADIGALLESGDPAIFNIENLVPFVFDRAPYSIAGELVNLASQLSPDGASPSESVGAIEFLVSVGMYDKNLAMESPAILDRFKRLIFPYLKAGVYGLYLEDENGTADIGATIRAGIILNELGTADALLNGIALELQKYGLSLSDSEGFIPTHADPKRPRENHAATHIVPEPIFVRLTQNGYMPREISLFESDGPGIWIWSAAGNFEVESTEDSYTLSFDFPVGFAHHLIFRGIEPFSTISLFGIPWKNDPLFQNYTSGWTYVEEQKTLYMKMTHRSIRERVVIRK